jgi:ABC-type bacteriocin/lantibiotic exporter with double-glycine peptidase domain
MPIGPSPLLADKRQLCTRLRRVSEPTRRLVLAGGLAALPAAPCAVPLPRSVLYKVPLIAQETAMSCWAAAIAMIVSWSTGIPVTPLQVATSSERLQQYKHGLDPMDDGLFPEWGMTTEAPQTFTADGFMELLRDYGPIWVAAKLFAPHIRVVTGFAYDAAPSYGIVYINDPLERGMRRFNSSNKGSAYSETYVQFVAENESLGFNEMKIYSPVYFAHLRHKLHD